MIRLNLFMVWLLHFLSLLSVICRCYRQNSSSRIIVVLVYTVSTLFANEQKWAGICSALHVPAQHAAMKDAARCVLQQRTTVKTRQGIIKGKTYAWRDKNKMPWASYPKGCERWEIQREIMPERSLHFRLCQ